MSFSETYRYEVVQSRKVRAQRAFFWSRIVGLALMITIAATLRADPQLRGVLMRVGMDGVTQMANLQGGSNGSFSLPGQTKPSQTNLPKPRIKVNRPASSVGTQTPDANAIAQQVGQSIARRQISN